MSRSDLRGDDEVDYLRQVELLALDVVDRAHDDGTLTYGPDRANETPLQAAVRALADGLRHYHFPGDGCVEEHPLLPLSGIVVIGPDSMPLHWDVEYADVCQRLGIPLRNEGWALWHAWDGKGRPITVVTSNLATRRVSYRAGRWATRPILRNRNVPKSRRWSEDGSVQRPCPRHTWNGPDWPTIRQSLIPTRRNSAHPPEA